MRGVMWRRSDMTQPCRICDASHFGQSSLCPDCQALLRWFRGYFVHDTSIVLEHIGPETRFAQDLRTDSLDYCPSWVRLSGWRPNPRQVGAASEGAGSGGSS